MIIMIIIIIDKNNDSKKNNTYIIYIYIIILFCLLIFAQFSVKHFRITQSSSYSQSRCHYATMSMCSMGPLSLAANTRVTNDPAFHVAWVSMFCPESMYCLFHRNTTCPASIDIQDTCSSFQAMIPWLGAHWVGSTRKASNRQWCEQRESD